MVQHPFEMLDLDRELTTDQRMIRDVVAQDRKSTRLNSSH